MSLKQLLNSPKGEMPTEAGLERLIEFISRKREGLSKKQLAEQNIRRARIKVYEQMKRVA